MKRITLILPMFNEEGAIGPLLDHLNTLLPRLQERFDVSFDILLVDDGSTDGTLACARAAETVCPAEILILSRNFGKEAALTAGLEAAEGDAAILMDSDMTQPTELLAEMIRLWQEGYQGVYTYKQHRNDEGWHKSLMSRAFYHLVNTGGRVEIPPDSQDFRLLDRRMIDALLQLPERERLMKGLFAWVGFRQIGLPFVLGQRASGQSSFGLGAVLRLGVDGLTAFSVRPIRYMTLLGFFVAGLSFVYLAYIVLERLIWGGPFAGFASIIVLVTFFGGLQLVCIGLIGEYLAKTLLEAKRRPLYLIADRQKLPRKPH